MRRRLWVDVIAVILGGALATRAAGQDRPAPAGTATPNIMADGYYVREAQDVEWAIRVRGRIESLCGAYLVVHDAAGAVLYQGVIPAGEHPATAPFTVRFPPDGRIGDYRIKIIGQQEDFLGIDLPLTTLPLEVYGGTNFCVGRNYPGRPLFRVPAGQDRVVLGGYRADVQVYAADGALVADSRTAEQPAGEKYDRIVEFPVQPDGLYAIEKQSFYFGPRGRGRAPLYLTFRADAWFAPDPALVAVKWWQTATLRSAAR